MEYTWFKIFNLNDFLATELISRTYDLNLEGIGQQEVLVTKGNEIGITHDGVFMVLNLNGKNPFPMDNRAVYIDSNSDVFLGIEIED